MDAIKKLAGFLTSLWGILAVVSISFPGAAALLDLPIAVENSKISELYPVIGMISSAFCLLMLISVSGRTCIRAICAENFNA